MNYPRRSPFLLYNRIDKDSFRIHNILNAKTYQLNLEFVSFLRQLNGRRDPYTIFPQHSRWYIRQLIRELKHCEMLAPKKVLCALVLAAISFLCFTAILEESPKSWLSFRIIFCWWLVFPYSFWASGRKHTSLLIPITWLMVFKILKLALFPAYFSD